MKKFMTVFIICVLFICSLSGCNREELLSSPFMMTVYPTYLNGAKVHSFPQKVFDNDELFTVLNFGNADEPFEVDKPVLSYFIEMVNGSNFTNFEIWNDGTVSMSYNLLFGDEYYLSREQYNALVDIIES